MAKVTSKAKVTQLYSTVSHWKYSMMTFASLNGNGFSIDFGLQFSHCHQTQSFAVNITYSHFPYRICICNYFIISFQFLQSGLVDERCTYHIDVFMVHTFKFTWYRLPGTTYLLESPTMALTEKIYFFSWDDLDADQCTFCEH